MPKTDLDWICDNASPEEVKRLMQLVHEWSQGDAHSFPVQLALLTRAQWRAASMVPRLVDESRQLMELKLTEYRQQTAALVQQFSNTADSKIEVVSTTISRHTESMNQAVAKVRGQITEAQNVAMNIHRELEAGAQAWNKARSDYETERNKLEKIRLELDAHNRRYDWLWAILILIGMIAIGIAIGLRISR